METMRQVGDAYVACSAVVLGDVRLGPGASLWHNVVARGDDAAILVGANANVQDLTMLHADPGVDLVIGDHVTVGHGAIVHCRRIGPKTLVGMGAILLAGAEIGECCIVAAGALVPEGAVIPDRSVVMGVPGKVVKPVAEGRADQAVRHALAYLEKARRHVAGQYPRI